jgi:N-acetyl sugar amidotransferase
MDTTDPEITFDDEDRCRHCTLYLKKRERRGYRGRESDAALDRLVDAAKRAGRGQSYDCIIGVSGGVDSSYLAYLAKARGLRALAVHMDNGWDSEKAVKNIKNVMAKLGFDYESYVLDWEEFKDLQLAFLKASVPEAETPTDVAIPAALHFYAAKYGVKYILSGGNLATEGILPLSWHYDAKDLKYFHHIQKTFGQKLLKTFPTFGYFKETFYKLVKGIKTAYPLDMVAYGKREATQLLADKFGWENYGAKHNESRYTKFIQSYYLFEKFQIDYRRAGFSSEICNGEVARETALDDLKRLPYVPAEIEEDKLYVAKKLGISREELDRIVALPAKWYWDYPNDRRKLAFIYDTYRKMFSKGEIGQVLLFGQ